MSTSPTISPTNVAIIILAGGSSSRLGKPKQLLQYQQKTLIKHAVKTALQTTAKPVIVVTGFLNEELVVELENERVQLIHNPDWQEGMGSSIRTGINALGKFETVTEIDAALMMLCDQPLITTEHLNCLITQFYADKRSMVVATAYAETKGAPAVFDKTLFPVLEVLSGDKGAQWLFKNYEKELKVVAFESAAIDVDTEEDYLRLIKLSGNNNP
ncbi:nucleotidyltransferase family protein [Mucilaginibacter arboris]|uniref:NTP transferase domain-containing protein n=1 Tax=Mucilaginibacter arboris TaxID=2682090 RepID=A0A7K1SXD8_9SPHI|nr:nucleotidyltransferase family protein [Mucilaginibacter arboris]MVN21897.1 NTP transferase domain-containing protein [Mucilaginibacter arboris]